VSDPLRGVRSITMNSLFKIVLFSISNFFAVASVILFFILILFGGTTDSTIYILKSQKILELFAIAPLIFLIALLLINFAYKHESIAISKVGYAVLLSAYLCFSLGLFRLLTMTQTRAKFVQKYSFQVDRAAQNFPGQKPTAEIMGLFLISLELEDEKIKSKIQKIIMENASFVFKKNYYHKGPFDEKPKPAITKGTHVLAHLILNRNYTLAEATASFVKNPNYKDPTKIIPNNWNLFEDVVREFAQFMYADLFETIKILRSRGGKLTTKNVYGDDIVTMLSKTRTSLDLAIKNHAHDRAERILRRKQIKEVIELLGGS